MITGFRLSHLADGEPLLGRAWEYKGKTGIDAAIKRLEDEFFNASYIGFNYVIDTIIPMVDSNGDFTLENNGVQGNVWSLDARLTEYKRLCEACHFDMVLEFQFPVEVTSANLNKYINFIMSVIVKYNWVKFWQIGVRPDKKYPTGNYNCSPLHYVELMRNIYPKVKGYDESILLGGPGCFDSFETFVEYDKSTPHISWLNDAMGDNFSQEDEYFETIGTKGFLQYIDFFTYQGRYQSPNLSYDRIDSLIQTLKTSIYRHIGNYLPLFSTWQGRQGDATNVDSSNQQAYYDMRELLKSLKVGTTPFLCELTDYYPEQSAYLGKYDPNRLNYGIFTWYMSQKTVYNTMLFVIQTLSEYDTVYKDSTHVYEKNDNVDCITFRRTADNVVYKATIIWSKSYANETVVLLPASYQREYQLPNTSRVTITNETQINLSGPSFIIVYERIEELEVDTDYISYCVEKKLRFQRDSLEQMLSELPSSYNTETRDTNVYRLLRALAVEMANAKLEMELIKRDLYLDFAREEAIYENFGALIKLRKKNTWSYEKYRNLVKGVTKSLLSGATLQSVTDALQLFTNFKVSIHEMYNNTEKYLDYIQAGVYPKWSFIIEIEKPIDDKTTKEDLEEDAFTVLRIVKPAHTLGLLIIVLSGEEDWKSQYYNKYKTSWETMDESNLSIDGALSILEQKYGWRSTNYSGTFQPGIYSNQPLLNNGVLLGPRYVLFDKSEFAVELTKGDRYIVPNKVYEDISYILQTTETDIVPHSNDVSYSSHVGYTEEPFGADQNIHLFKLGDSLNQYMLGNNHRSRLKDTFDVDYYQWFEDEFHLSQNIKVIRFSTNYGFNAKFINNNDSVVEIGELLTEHSFRKKIHHYIPDKTITDRFKLNDSLLNNSKLYPYPEDGYDYEEERLKEYLYGNETELKESKENNNINFIQGNIENELEAEFNSKDIFPELGSNHFLLNDKIRSVLNQVTLSNGFSSEQCEFESFPVENIFIQNLFEDTLENHLDIKLSEDIFEQCDNKAGEGFNYFKDIYEHEPEFKDYYLPFFTLNRDTLNDFMLSPRILVLDTFQIEANEFSEIYPAIVEDTSTNISIATYQESMYKKEEETSYELHSDNINESNKVVVLSQEERNDMPIEILPLDKLTIDIDTSTTSENVKELLNPRYAFRLGIPSELTPTRNLRNSSQDRISLLNRFCSKLNVSKLGTTVSLDDSPVRFIDEGRVEEIQTKSIKDNPFYEPGIFTDAFKPFFFTLNKTLLGETTFKDSFTIDDNQFTDKFKGIKESLKSDYNDFNKETFIDENGNHLFAKDSISTNTTFNTYTEPKLRKKLYLTKQLLHLNPEAKDEYKFEIKDEGKITGIEVINTEDMSVSKDAENGIKFITLNKSLLNSSAVLTSTQGQRITDRIDLDTDCKDVHKVVSNIPYAFKFNNTTFNNHPFLSANTTDHEAIFEPGLVENIDKIAGDNTKAFGIENKELIISCKSEDVFNEYEEPVKDNYNFNIEENEKRNIEVNRKEKYKLKYAVAYCELTRIVKGTTIVIRRGTFV